MTKHRFIIISLFLSSLTLFSCKEEEKVEQKKDYTTISGTVENINDGYILLHNIRTNSVDSLEIEEGRFEDTLNVEAGHYNLLNESFRQPIYLDNGFKLGVSFDAKSLDSTIAFTGNGAEINNYLLEKSRYIKQYQEEKSLSNEISEEDYLQWEQEKMAGLEEILRNNDISDDFKQREMRNIHYAYIADLTRYNYSQMQKDTTYQPSQEILAEIDAVDFENAEDYFFSSSYRGLISSYYRDKAETLGKKDSIPRGLAYLKIVGKIKNDSLRNSLLYDSAQYGMTSLTDHLDSYYRTFLNVSTNEEHKEEITRIYKKTKKIQPGNPSPQFVNYENYEGGENSLTDFRGKYVYIDLWATWCGPCLANKPYLKKIKEEYKDKNIEFVNISLDAQENKDKWREMIEEKGFNGIQLFADNSFKSQFATDYQVYGIPHYILIDPDGNIISSNAPRPSGPELRTLLNSLNI